MDLKTIIDLCDVKEKQAFALTAYLNGKVEISELQKQVDSYCVNLANSFLSQHQAHLQDKTILIGLRRYIVSIGANNKHSGHRFYEALYTQLNSFESSITANNKQTPTR